MKKIKYNPIIEFHGDKMEKEDYLEIHKGRRKDCGICKMKNKKIKIEIKSWLNGSVLFEYSCVDNTIKKTVEKAVSERADLSYADLRYADLSSANLSYADLRYADLSSANLSYADLYSADLSSANLYYADLSSANLSYVDLYSADLYSANLSYADLRYANLSSADLRSVDLDIWWHVHHEVLWEALTEPIRNRINYIKKEKPRNEIKLRLKLLKPVLGEFPKDNKGWEDLHKKECKKCPWNGKTIFPK